MSWIKVSLDATDEAIDWVKTLLSRTNYVEDVQIRRWASSAVNHQEKGQSWAFQVCFYLPCDRQSEAHLVELSSLLSPLQRAGMISEFDETVIEAKPVSSEDPPLPLHRIGKRFVVLTPDTPYASETEGEILLRLDPSFAFGTGFHPATNLTLQLLERYVVPDMRVLDLGSGSGILSVAIAKLGAQVIAVDNDRVAVQATQDAVNHNHVSDQVTVLEGSLGKGSLLGHWMGGDSPGQVPEVEAKSNFDLIVSNILARVHIALASDYQLALRRTTPRSGILITAGFTTDYEAEVDRALVETGFNCIDSQRINEWVVLAHQLRATPVRC